MNIKISSDLSLPLDVVTQTLAILAKRRAGKSYTMRRVFEQLFKAGQQIVIVDPKGDQWGVRSDANGKDPGLPIVILGGERGDVPLEASSGEIIAKMVVEERISVLLDLSLFRKHEVSTFMTAFMENIYRLKAREIYRTPLMLVIDEADAIAPQKPQKGEERMLGAAEDIVRRGGQRGIGCVLVTQRSAVLNKNVLTQAQILVVLRTIAPQDLAAMKAWIDVHGDEEQGKKLMASLPSLPIGDAWFWSPGWPTVDGIFKRVHVLPIETFDSGASPKPGAKVVEPKNLADIDLDALKGHMTATIEKAKADDPKLLRKQIAELEQQAKKPRDLAVDTEALDKEYTRGKVDGYKAAIDSLVPAVDRLSTLRSALDEQLGDFVKDFTRWKQSRPPAENPVTQSRHAVRASVPTVARARQIDAARSANGSLPAGERSILIACAQHAAFGCTREQLSILTGYKRSTRNAYIQRLSEKGYIEFRGEQVEASDHGRHAIGSDFEPLPTGEALRDYWIGRLPEGERKVLQVAIKAYPEFVSREAIGGETGYKRSTRNAYIQRLTTRQLVVAQGDGIGARDELFS